MDDGSERALPSRPSIEVERLSDEVAIVHLRGEHGLSTKLELTAALNVASERPRVLVDLTQCTFIDSTVIAVLLAAQHKQVVRKQRLELIVPNDAYVIERILTLSRIRRIITVHETRRAALATRGD
jgi:anti-anti-sigma factor